MIRIRKAGERGHVDHGWLYARHSFSFGDYHDPAHMGFRSLRVINEDTVQPGQGFGTHPHRDMEIITYVLEGALEHKDSMGTGAVIRPGEFQKMSAGTGITHSEFNHSREEPVHLLQIWILPERSGIKPEYEQKTYSEEEKLNRLRVVASRDAREGAIRVYQDMSLYASLLEANRALEYRNAASRHAWLQVARGGIELNGSKLDAGDGVAVSGEELLRISGREPRSEFLLFDLS
jgi:redox-sensitive bicupin YhaK (pirin superfamily)